MNILISSIVRNEAQFLHRWYAQLKSLVEGCPDIGFHLSVFENDSTDGSNKLLGLFDFSFFKSYQVTSARMNLPYFVGGKHPTRTELLAYCRNRTIYNFAYLQEMDFVLVVEPDTEFDFATIEKIVNHQKHYGQKFDVFSGKSVHPGTRNIYDSWGTRKTDHQTDWLDADGQEGGLEKMWSTFNCVVIYNAEAIKQNCNFGGINPRSGQADCDTVVICERFRAAGFTNIAWDTNLMVQHHIAQ